MNRFLSVLVGAAFLVSPMVAGASGSFVRQDGVSFDSDVGAACGALHTDVLFAPLERDVDLLDEPVLDFLAACLSSGPLADSRVAVIGFGDDGPFFDSGADLARDRVTSVLAYLMARGVDARHLPTWSYAGAWAGDRDLTTGRVQFRILEGSPLGTSF